MPFEELLKNPENIGIGAGVVGLMFAGLVSVIRTLAGLLASKNEAETVVEEKQVDNQGMLIGLLTQMNERVIKSLEELVRSNTENSETQKRQTAILESINTGIAGFPGQLSANTGIAMAELRDKLLVLNNFANDFQEKMHPIYDYVTAVFAEKDAQIAALSHHIDTQRATLEAIMKENAELKAKNAVLDTAGAMIKRMNEEIKQQPSQEKATEEKADQSSADPNAGEIQAHDPKAKG